MKKGEAVTLLGKVSVEDGEEYTGSDVKLEQVTLKWVLKDKPITMVPWIS